MPLRVGEKVFPVMAAEEAGQRHPQSTEAQPRRTGRNGCGLGCAHFSILDMRKGQV